MTSYIKLTDWVSYYRGDFPHIVCVNSNTMHSESLHSWLRTHVGERDLTWQYPQHLTYMFRDPDHAILFSLMWGGV